MKFTSDRFVELLTKTFAFILQRDEQKVVKRIRDVLAQTKESVCDQFGPKRGGALRNGSEQEKIMK